MVKEEIKSGGYQIVKQGKEDVIRISLAGVGYPPSLENSALCMMQTVSKLSQVPGVSRIIFTDGKNYEYGYEQTQMLVEIAGIYNHLIKQKNTLTFGLVEGDSSRRTIIQNLIINILRSDPIGCYVEIKRILREEKINSRVLTDETEIRISQMYISLLDYILVLLDKTKMISRVKTYLDGHIVGDRDIYSKIFRSIITPDFMYTRLTSRVPLDGELLDSYRLDKETDVSIFRVPNDIKYLYHLNPPEFKLDEDKLELIHLARTVLAEHKPREEEFIDPERMRVTFFNIGRDMLQELADRKGLRLNYSELKQLTNVLVRYTVGFGLVETLLKDQKVQDITLNGPMGQTPIFLVHQDYDECVTNITPSREDALSWATKFRILSGRPLDEANPVLDTELILPEARARVAIISTPLSPWGLAYALRRHRDKPWTLPLFVSNKMITPMAAGLMSFLIDGARTLLIAGTRSSGKTSFLGATLVEIMRKYRIITAEDSVTGDSEMLIKRNGEIEKVTIGNLIDSLIEKHGCWYNLSEHEILGNDENIEVFAMNKEGKIGLSRISKFIRHKVSKPIYKIKTKTGGEIKVTGDHSLFGLDKNAGISEAKVRELKEKDFIAVPRRLKVFKDDVGKINLLNYRDKLKEGFFCGDSIKKFVRMNKEELVAIGKEHGYTYNTVKSWLSRGIVPVKVIDDIISLGFKLDFNNDVTYKVKSSWNKLPIEISLDKDILTLIGIWIADGCYDRSSVLICVQEPELRKIVRNVAKKYGFKVTMHSDGFTLIIHSKIFKTLMREVFELKGNAYTKRIPSWIFNLSDKQISCVLKGIFSGDGCCAYKEIVIPLASRGLLEDIRGLLLRFEIGFRIGKIRRDKTYNASISNLKSWLLFRENVGFLQKYKNERLNKLCDKISTHDTSDVIPLHLESKKAIKAIYSDFKHRDYILRNNNVGREKLNLILEQVSLEDSLVENLKILANSDIFWDQIISIETVNDYEGYVYDLSVPQCESFICNNVVAHNTLELPTDSLRNLGYNIQPMKVRSALGRGGTEVAADEGIRTALRMGDSALIVGEIRSTEASALYEAMRVGALANVVAGTIHGDSPYGVFDRVVNDLKVPRTSFKATDIIVVANPVRSADGLHKWRRVTQITEVRKTWEEDPLREGGFVDLMKYDSKEDRLKPTDELLNGNSEVIKNVAANIKEWAGDWDAVWNNIILRAKVKEALVNYSRVFKKPEMLEAEFVIQSNDMFHIISESVKDREGVLNSELIYQEWEDWLKKRLNG